MKIDGIRGYEFSTILIWTSFLCVQMSCLCGNFGRERQEDV